MDDGPAKNSSLVTRIYGGVSERVGNGCALLIVGTACLVALVLAVGITIALCRGRFPSPSAVSTFGAAVSGSGVTGLATYLGLNRESRDRSGDRAVTSPSGTDQADTTAAPEAEPARGGRSSRTQSPQGTTPAATGSVPGGPRPPGGRRWLRAGQRPAKTP